MSKPQEHNSRTVILAGFIFTGIGVFFWPMLLIGIPLLIVGGIIREGERHKQAQEAAHRQRQ